MAPESTAPVAAPAASTRPAKPDDDLFKENVAKAEKEYADAIGKYVCSPILHCSCLQYILGGASQLHGAGNMDGKPQTLTQLVN